MIIRRATTADAAEIANVHINSWREAYRGLLPQSFLDDRPLDFRRCFEVWKRVVADETQVTFVAESKDHGVVGFVNGGDARDAAYRGYCEVWCLYLLRRYHGQRVGIRLLKAYFDVFLEKGLTKGYLWVLKDNPTIKFYEKAGAKRTKDVKEDVIGEQRVEELCYVWNDIKLELK